MSGAIAYGNWEFLAAAASSDGSTVAVTSAVGNFDYEEPPTLALRVRWEPGAGDQMELFVAFPDKFIASDDSGMVNVTWALRPARIGNAGEEWGVSMGGDAVFSLDPRGLAQQLKANTESMFSVVVVDDFNDGFEATFSLDGAEPAIRGVLEALD